jgi:hypothetical protein
MEIFVDRIEVMEGLANGNISPRLPFLLESLDCLKSGELQYLIINFCDRSKVGLFCEMSMNIHKIVTEYLKYLPLSYNNVRFRAEKNNQILVKSLTNH